MRRMSAWLIILCGFLTFACGTKTTVPSQQTECNPGDVQVCPTQCQSSGKKVCGSTGYFGLCNPPQETCNGKDDDCDNQIDEGLVNCGGNNNCQQNQTQQCVTPCSTVGIQQCVNGQWAPCSPPQEACDGIDNDCDAQIDEGIQVACNNTCGAGFQTCVGGAMSQCSAPSPTPENCDSVDNDCDGAIDEGDIPGQPLTSLCPLGDTTRKCINGQWITDPEVCDGIDNNCNGVIDDAPGGCNCTAGEEKTCGGNIGVCQAGVSKCVTGLWTECGGNGYIGATPEKCDGLDNDCNNLVDDLPTTNQLACGSVECGVGIKQCSGGQMVCVGGVDIVTDQYEPNPSCIQGKPVAILEELGVQTITANVTQANDVDWFKITASEKGGLFSGCDTSKPEYYRTTITLAPPSALDLDLCVFPANTNSCGSLPASGLCEDLPCEAGQGTCQADGTGIFSGNEGGVETFVHEWEGKCGGVTTDKMDYYVKVASYEGGDQCSTYTISAQLTSWQN